MPESDAEPSATPRQAFTELLNSVLPPENRNGPWLAGNLRDPDTGEGDIITRQTASEWINGKRVGRVTVKNCRALEALFGVHQSAWYIAAGVQSGLEPPRTGGFANRVNPVVDRYPEHVQQHFVAIIDDYGRAAGLLQPQGSATS